MPRVYPCAEAPFVESLQCGELAGSELGEPLATSVIPASLDQANGAPIERAPVVLPPELIEALGMILGEALALQYQRDADAMSKTRRGLAYTRKKPGRG